MKNHFFTPVFSAIKNWYIPLIGGILHIIMGIIVLSSPEESILALAIFFGLTFLIAGVFEIIFALSNKIQLENWQRSLGFGILTVLIGLILTFNPPISITTIALFVGFTILFRSIITIAFSLDLKNYGSDKWGWLFALGIVGVLLSLILLWEPRAAVLSLVVLIGFSFIIAGVFGVYLSLLLRRIHNHSTSFSSKLKERMKEIKKHIEEEWD